MLLYRTSQSLDLRETRREGINTSKRTSVENEIRQHPHTELLAHLLVFIEVHLEQEDLRLVLLRERDELRIERST